jgi:hypothetical protein
VSVYFWAVFIFISGKWESYNVSSHKSLSLLVFFLFEEGNKIRLLRLEAYTAVWDRKKASHREWSLEELWQLNFFIAQSGGFRDVFFSFFFFFFQAK